MTIFCVTTLVTAGIIFNSGFGIILGCVLSFFCVFTQSKGLIITHLFCFFGSLFYMTIAFGASLYGEVITNGLFAGMEIVGFINWIRHMDDNKVQVLVGRDFSLKEWIYSILGCAVVSVGVFFLLRAINTSFIWTSIVSFFTLVVAFYLLVRRNRFSQLVFLINDLFVVNLWILTVLGGSLMHIPMIINVVFQVSLDIYGIITWKKLAKRQSEKGGNSQIQEQEIASQN